MLNHDEKKPLQRPAELDFVEYQWRSARTANHTLDPEKRAMIAGLGLNGESGEVAELLKKALGHGHPYDEEKMIKELGDVLWYVAELCTIHGLRMDRVAQRNIEKLEARYPGGFSEQASRERTV
jgi:NTP pyrophosphatase (non-canonical NTP hydrolase)